MHATVVRNQYRCWRSRPDTVFRVAGVDAEGMRTIIYADGTKNVYLQTTLEKTSRPLAFTNGMLLRNPRNNQYQELRLVVRNEELWSADWDAPLTHCLKWEEVR